jgi:hypothetical protein
MEIKRLKAVNEGKVHIGEMNLNCAVLEDGTRIITYSAVFEAFGRTKRGAQRDEGRVHDMPAFLNAKNLQPFVGDDLRNYLILLDYDDINGTPRTGYNALILPRLCKVYLDARAAGINPETKKPYLARQQEPLARASEILLLGLSNVGVIALVDEATGYQYRREQEELQKILKAYISEALLPWQQRFPPVFYKEIFRLNGWDFSVSEITRRRPGVVGTWTNQFVYEQLPKDVLKTLKEKTPKNEAGQYKAKFHQSLSEDVGHPGLQSQISSVVALMQISDTWEGFKSHFERLRIHRTGQLALGLSTSSPKQLPSAKPENEFDAGLRGLLNIPPPPKTEKGKKKPKPPKDDEADGESSAELVPA